MASHPHDFVRTQSTLELLEEDGELGRVLLDSSHGDVVLETHEKVWSQPLEELLEEPPLVSRLRVRSGESTESVIGRSGAKLFRGPERPLLSTSGSRRIVLGDQDEYLGEKENLSEQEGL